MYYIWVPDWESAAVDEVSTPDRWNQLILLSGEQIDPIVPLPQFLIPADDVTDALVNHLAYLVFNSKLRAVLDALTHDPIQYLPANVICSATGKQIRDYAICNPLVQLEGIDKDLSLIDYGHRNSIIGIDRLVLNKEQVSGHSFFRLAEFFPILIVREDVAEGIIEAGCTGVTFQAVEEFRV